VRRGSILLIILSILSAFIIAAGTLFRTMHWPMGRELLYAGVGGMVICALLLAFRIVEKALKP